MELMVRERVGAVLILGPPGRPGSHVLTGAVGQTPERGKGWKRLSPGCWEQPGQVPGASMPGPPNPEL